VTQKEKTLLTVSLPANQRYGEWIRIKDNNAGFATAVVSGTNIEQRWAYGSALHVENPSVGRFTVLGTMTTIELLNPSQHNWLICSVSAPNTLEGWKVKAIMILYNIRRPDPRPLGMIDKIGI
jgi:hypothetical protein